MKAEFKSLWLLKNNTKANKKTVQTFNKSEQSFLGNIAQETPIFTCLYIP